MTGPTEKLRHEITEALEEANSWGMLEVTLNRRTGLSWREARNQIVDGLLVNRMSGTSEQVPASPHADAA